MPKFGRFLRLYCTDLVTANAKVIADPVRVEFFEGPREYDVLVRIAPPIVLAGVDRPLFKQQRMSFVGDRSYIELVARTETFFGGRQYCEDHIDRVVTQLSALLSPALFNFEVWSGWLSDSEHVLGNGWLMMSPPVNFEATDLARQIQAYRHTVALDPDLDQRFTLMSKLFSRALTIEPGEERFLWLWTVLEVFPMRDTANIQPIADYVAQVTGRASADVKRALDVGRLFGARSELVHDGRLPYNREALGEVLNKLETLDLTILRAIGGLSYSGQLDKYFS
jgi:hypothetical protein